MTIVYSVPTVEGMNGIRDYWMREARRSRDELRAAELEGKDQQDLEGRRVILAMFVSSARRANRVAREVRHHERQRRLF